MNKKPQHATITLEFSYSAPIERVFAEFADPAARARWSVPAGDILIYDQSNFHEGGQDIFRCGPGTDPKFRGTTTYHLIIPNQRVISTETLDTGDKRLAVSLTTLEFEPAEGGTTLKVTVQIISLVGPGMIAGYESGNKSALENLAHHLSGKH